MTLSQDSSTAHAMQNQVSSDELRIRLMHAEKLCLQKDKMINDLRLELAEREHKLKQMTGQIQALTAESSRYRVALISSTDRYDALLKSVSKGKIKRSRSSSSIGRLDLSHLSGSFSVPSSPFNGDETSSTTTPQPSPPPLRLPDKDRDMEGFSPIPVRYPLPAVDEQAESPGSISIVNSAVELESPDFLFPNGIAPANLPSRQPNSASPGQPNDKLPPKVPIPTAPSNPLPQRPSQSESPEKKAAALSSSDSIRQEETFVVVAQSSEGKTPVDTEGTDASETPARDEKASRHTPVGRAEEGTELHTVQSHTSQPTVAVGGDKTPHINTEQGNAVVGSPSFLSPVVPEAIGKFMNEVSSVKDDPNALDDLIDKWCAIGEESGTRGDRRSMSM